MDDRITKLLADWRSGDVAALKELMPLVLVDLRRIAGRYMAREAGYHTLQPTALINEVYILLEGQRKVTWKTRIEFFQFAAELMRRILLNHARAHQTQKRGKNATKVSLDEHLHDFLNLPSGREVEFIALDEALTALAAVDARQAQIVELRAFLGLTNEEIAEILGISPTTIKRDWSAAKEFLRPRLG